ncbi:HlyD family secretion protein [Methylobacterium sp. ID0610]|uniref:HlyD family secretion protein n=1 Tax=Methylobacterium carpenticola TaxID=3344827 RepID=UPI0036CCE6BE
MFWNSRAVRILVGVLLLGAAVLAVLPNVTGYTSLDGTVNARFTIIAAPIEGVVSATPPKVGTPVPEGEPLYRIRNERIARTAEAQLEADLGATRERLRALEGQIASLTAIRNDLAGRLKEYQQASITGVQQEIVIRQQRINAAQAQQISAQADLARKTTLGATGVVAGSSVEQARAALVAATSEQAIARADLERLTRQLEALRKGTFVGEGRNDVPYSQQRQDEVAIQLANVQMQARAERARIQQLERQIALESERNDKLSTAVVRVPFEGVIWRNNVVAGSNVVVGNELTRLLDCRDLFVDILVNEADYDSIRPNSPAEVRLLGGSQTIRGTVLSVRGSSAAVEEVVLAAVPPESRGKTARIRVALEPNDMQRDFANFCQVGRSVQVRIARSTKKYPLVNWVRSLWFSIS